MKKISSSEISGARIMTNAELNRIHLESDGHSPLNSELKKETRSKQKVSLADLRK